MNTADGQIHYVTFISMANLKSVNDVNIFFTISIYCLLTKRKTEKKSFTYTADITILVTLGLKIDTLF